MRKRMAFALAALSILFVLVATTNPAMAATYTNVGVKPGSSSIYATSFSGGFSTTVNKTVISIFAVVGTVVYENVTYYLPNNAFNNENDISVDVSVNDFYSMQSIIASGLTAGDPAYPSAPYKINDSSTMTAAGASRTVNHFKMSVFNSSVDFLEIWWDKNTGIVVKFNWWYAILSGWDNVTMISTTAWPSTPPEGLLSLTTIALVGGVGIVAVVVGFLVGRSGKRRK